MVGSALQRSIRSARWHTTKHTLPKKFTLNKGHVKFFYDKGKYLSNRYDMLREEMKARGMNPDDTRVFKREQWPDELWNDWTPSLEDYKLIRQRIEDRINMKPNWYRKTNYVS